MNHKAELGLINNGQKYYAMPECKLDQRMCPICCQVQCWKLIWNRRANCLVRLL
jgi:hypothetical protein